MNVCRLMNTLRVLCPGYRKEINELERYIKYSIPMEDIEKAKTTLDEEGLIKPSQALEYLLNDYKEYRWSKCDCDTCVYACIDGNDIADCSKEHDWDELYCPWYEEVCEED